MVKAFGYCARDFNLILDSRISFVKFCFVEFSKGMRIWKNSIVSSIHTFLIPGEQKDVSVV